ncbi:hypothetical protein [Alcanivorax sp.]|jgi:hypothetical protein|uniref:hypothetical protein n=1 Tax=Alcanivorax sp. TaxID=1872427 RepID=UPI0025C4F41C|nr:hypothetical protein [Alcanivorax sp.]
MKLSIGLVIASALVVLGLWFIDIASDQENAVEITAPVSAYTEWECGYPDQLDCSVVFEAYVGEKYDVRRIRYGKDFMAIKIQQGDLSGWVFSGEGVRVHAKPNT